MKMTCSKWIYRGLRFCYICCFVNRDTMTQKRIYFCLVHMSGNEMELYP